MKVLVTGNAGFIGFHTARSLLARGDTVVGIDNLNDYYDIRLKKARLQELEKAARLYGTDYHFIQSDLADNSVIEDCFGAHAFDRIIHLAAQAGVRYSIKNPHAYVQSNIVSFVNLLEAASKAKVAHFTFASSSSVYGSNSTLPSCETHGTDHPLQFYAATKRSNELMAHSYSNIYQLPTTGLRFFSVYGPWSRPDMAVFKFTKKILEGEPIQVFNNTNHSRDFTYIDDIVDGILKASDSIATASQAFDPASPDPSISSSPFRILNLGNNAPIKLGELIATIESVLGKEAIKENLPYQPGDALDTHADINIAEALLGYRPTVSFQEGVRKFVDWYKSFHRVD